MSVPNAVRAIPVEVVISGSTSGVSSNPCACVDVCRPCGNRSEMFGRCQVGLFVALSMIDIGEGVVSEDGAVSGRSLENIVSRGMPDVWIMMPDVWIMLVTSEMDCST